MALPSRTKTLLICFPARAGGDGAVEASAGHHHAVRRRSLRPPSRRCGAWQNRLKIQVGSTGRCNTLGFRCCLNRRCGSGEAGSSGRVVRGGQEGAVEAVEGRGVHKRHRPGTTEASRLHPWDARGHRRDLSARAVSAQMRAHPRPSGRRSPGGSLPENPFVQSPLGWAAVPPPCAGR